MKKWILAMVCLVVIQFNSGCTLVKVYLKEEPGPLQEHRIYGRGRDKVLVMDIAGMITSSDSGRLIGDSKQVGLVARVREEFDKARMDKAVKAVVIRINSPGGAVTASDTLYHEIKKFKSDTGAKVVAHIMDVGASGAYYAALAADRIIAQPTSITGSIGVVMFRIDATGLMQKIGVQATQIASGERKGMGSPFKSLSPEEEKIFRGVIDGLYNRFVELVAEERRMQMDKVRRLSDGRIFTASEAMAEGLIDGIGYLDDAVDAAKRLADIEKAMVVVYSRPGEFRPNIYAMNLISIDAAGMFEPGVQFLYVWSQ